MYLAIYLRYWEIKSIASYILEMYTTTALTTQLTFYFYTCV